MVLGDSDSHHVRTQRLIYAGGWFLLIQGVLWATFYFAQGVNAMGLTEALLAILGLIAIALCRGRQYRVAKALMVICVYFTLCWICIWLDPANAVTPRVTHLYLLAAGLCSFYVMQEDPPGLMIFVVGIYFLTFWFFSVTHFHVPVPYAIPADIRAAGSTTVNAAGAMFVIVLMLYLISTDREASSGMHSDMREALAQGHFELHYQPQVDADGRVFGSEALLRWQDPKRGLIAPGVFIPMAEQSGFIFEIGSWALNAACEQLVRWRSIPGLSHLTLSINVSALQVRQSNFVTQVLDTLARSGAPAALLKLELTESMLVNDVDDVIEKMRQLSLHGVAFSLDDFGTGYSSLGYLNRLPLQQLKIDQMFVRDAAEDRNAAAIARTLISLGQSLGLTVVAEGVEIAAQRDFLLKEGCRYFQGFLFSQPLDAASFESYVRRTNQGAFTDVASSRS
jgi:EAL domain-containing protein (putative c-di-GMP-specific phosphodiesterase class I)